MFRVACHYWKKEKADEKSVQIENIETPFENKMGHIPIEENVKIGNSLQHQIETSENNFNKIDREIEERTKILDELTDSKYHPMNVRHREKRKNETIKRLRTKL